MSEVKANLVAGFDEAKSPGDYFFLTRNGEPTRIAFMCPCGCGALGQVAVKDDGCGGPVWQWNGDRKQPTITPSILRSGGGPTACTYHGFLTNGVFRSC